MKINHCYYSLMNEGHLWYCIWSCFLLPCSQFTVYPAVVCLTTLQPFIKALLSIIWCSQLKLRKAFGEVCLTRRPLTLFSLTEMSLLLFPLCPGSVVIRWISKLHNQQGFVMFQFSTSVSQHSPSFFFFFHVHITSKENQEISTQTTAALQSVYIHLPTSSLFLLQLRRVLSLSSPHHQHRILCL